MRRIECRVMAGAGAMLSVIGVLLSAFVTELISQTFVFTVVLTYIDIQFS